MTVSLSLYKTLHPLQRRHTDDAQTDHRLSYQLEVTMNTSSEPGNATPRRSVFSRMTVVAFLAGAALAGSIAAVAAAESGSGEKGNHCHSAEDGSTRRCVSGAALPGSIAAAPAPARLG